jgi:hypothetical protein
MLSGLALALAALLCMSCASARVKGAQTERITRLPRPARVIVYDFGTGGADVQVVTSPGRRAARSVGLLKEQPDLLADAVADTLASKLVTDINALGLRAERARGALPPQMNDLVVEGDFLRIDEGDQARRFVIGFGAGATELKTQVRVFQVTTDGWRQVQQFDTIATGSRMPGAGWFVAGGAVAGTVATSAMISSGVGVARELRASIDADAGRTSAQIAKQVSELKTAQGW